MDNLDFRKEPHLDFNEDQEMKDLFATVVANAATSKAARNAQQEAPNVRAVAKLVIGPNVATAEIGLQAKQSNVDSHSLDLDHSQRSQDQSASEQ